MSVALSEFRSPWPPTRIPGLTWSPRSQIFKTGGLGIHQCSITALRLISPFRAVAYRVRFTPEDPNCSAWLWDFYKRVLWLTMTMALRTSESG
jgi:hypothetical protein